MGYWSKHHDQQLEKNTQHLVESAVQEYLNTPAQAPKVCLIIYIKACLRVSRSNVRLSYKGIRVMPEITLVDAVNMGLMHEMAADPDVVVLGEDIGLNGGVFRATDGLQKNSAISACLTPR